MDQFSGSRSYDDKTILSIPRTRVFSDVTMSHRGWSNRRQLRWNAKNACDVTVFYLSCVFRGRGLRILLFGLVKFSQCGAQASDLLLRHCYTMKTLTLRSKPVWVALVSLSILLAGSGWRSDTKPTAKDAEFHLRQARDYERKEMWGEAIAEYEKFLSFDPNRPEVHLLLGAAYLELERWQEAIEPLEKAVRLTPEDPVAHFLLGAAYFELQRTEEAIGALKEAVRLRPEDGAAYFLLAASQSNLGRHKEAVKAYEEAIRLKFNNARAYYNLGTAYLAIGNHGAALDQYHLLRGLDPKLAKKLFDLMTGRVFVVAPKKIKRLKGFRVVTVIEDAILGREVLRDTFRELAEDRLNQAGLMVSDDPLLPMLIIGMMTEKSVGSEGLWGLNGGVIVRDETGRNMWRCFHSFRGSKDRLEDWAFIVVNGCMDKFIENWLTASPAE